MQADLLARLGERGLLHAAVARLAPAPDEALVLQRVEVVGQRRAGDRDGPAESPERRAQRIRRRAQDRDRVPGQVLGDDLAVAVVHESARRSQRDGAHLIARRLRLELGVPQDLEPEEPGDQYEQAAENGETGEVGATISTEGIEWRYSVSVEPRRHGQAWPS